MTIKYSFVFYDESFQAVDRDGIVSVLQANYRAEDSKDKKFWEVTIRVPDLPLVTPVTPIPYEEITRAKAESWLTDYLKRTPASEEGYANLMEYYKEYMADQIIASRKRGIGTKQPKPMLQPDAFV